MGSFAVNMSSKVVAAVYVGNFRETFQSYEHFGISVDVGIAGSAKHPGCMTSVKIYTDIARYQTCVTSSINLINMTAFKVNDCAVYAVSGDIGITVGIGSGCCFSYNTLFAAAVHLCYIAFRINIDGGAAPYFGVFTVAAAESAQGLGENFGQLALFLYSGILQRRSTEHLQGICGFA